MKIWLIREAENYPFDENSRLQRMGLIAEEFLKSGHEVVWWHSTFNHFKKEFIFSEDKSIKINDKYRIELLHEVGYKKNVSVSRMIHHYKMAKKFYKRANLEKERPDLIIVSMPHISFTKYAVKYANKYNIPVYVDVRDLNPDVFVAPFKGLIRSIVSLGITPLKSMLRKSLKNATGILATTQPYLDWALTNYAKRPQGNKDSVFFVSYPFSEPLKELPIHSKWKNFETVEGIKLCFFGQFANLADINTVIDCARLCKEKGVKSHFLLCGQGELLNNYIEICKHSNLDNVYFPGWVDKKDILEIGSICDLGLMAYKPSQNFEKQITNKFSEYLALKLGILLQPTGVMNDVINEYKCGFHYTNSEELFEIICKLSADKMLLNCVKNNSRLLFEERFCAEKVYKELVSFTLEE